MDKMELEVDIPPDRLVAWLQHDFATSAQPRFEVSANRVFVEEPVSGGRAGLDVNDDEAVLSVFGVLELRPLPVGVGRWSLRLQIEDALADHLPDEGGVPDEPEEMTLEGFEAAFIAPGRGLSYATLEIADEQARGGFDSFLADLQSGRH